MSQRLKEIKKIEFPHLHIVSLIRVQKNAAILEQLRLQKNKLK